MSNGSIGVASNARAINRVPAYQIIPKDSSKVNKSSIEKIKKVKKMNWLKRKFAKWSREVWESAQEERVASDGIKGYDGINGKISVRFTVYPASGGFVIEHYKQDRYKDNQGPELTIVNHGEDLGKAVEHIITLEALRS
jgi:hypothetical protein